MAKRSQHPQVCYDHKGNEYPSKTEMCKAYGVTLTAFLKRLDRRPGDIMYALEGYKIEDPLHPGTYYHTQTDLCRHYGISPEVYRSRLKLGWTQERALTVPMGKKKSPQSIAVIIDGVEYPSIVEACAAHGLSPSTYYKRMTYGWTQEDAIKIPLKKKSGPRRTIP